jgi:hypothetical protein
MMVIFSDLVEKVM